MWFLGTPSSGENTEGKFLGTDDVEGAASAGESVQQIVQQGGEATVWLRRSTLRPFAGSTGDRPIIACRGRELPAVNQTVAFAAGETLAENQGTIATITVPTNAGAPNPGEVDVNLTITPIDPPAGVTVNGPPLELRIMAPDSTTPPRIIGVAGPPKASALLQQADEPCASLQRA